MWLLNEEVLLSILISWYLRIDSLVILRFQNTKHFLIRSLRGRLGSANARLPSDFPY